MNMFRKRALLCCICIWLACVGIVSADEKGPYRDRFIEGYLTDIGWYYGDYVEIEEYDGTSHKLWFHPEAYFRIDGIPVRLEDFEPGLEVYGELEDGDLKYLESYSTQNPGYIPPGGKVRTGIVKKIDRDQIVLKELTGEENSYFTSYGTIVVRKGRTASLSDLYEGDRVKLYFDEVDSRLISRMHIEGDSVLVKDLYRGKLAIADDLSNKIVVEEAEVFRNGKWQEERADMQISYDRSFPLYMGGQQIPYQNMKYLKGKTVYLAVKDFFGSNKAEKMVIKNQYETAYSSKIEHINYYSDQFELDNRKNIRFHDGTIIIKNGRLVDKESVLPNSDALVIADGRGTDLVADVIHIYNEDLNNSNMGQNQLYAGRLSRITQDKVYLKDFYLLEYHDWVSFATEKEKDEKELYYDGDTHIYDLENRKKVSMKEFFAMDYAVDEDSDYVRDNDLKDWYAYIYTDGDRIASILLQKNMDSLLRQRITNGIVESVQDDALVGWKISLRDAKDWSSRNEKWMARNASLSIHLSKCMIVKGGRMIEPEELRSGDRLYIVRDDATAKVIIVK
jgi:hypothetical protein